MITAPKRLLLAALPAAALACSGTVTKSGDFAGREGPPGQAGRGGGGDRTGDGEPRRRDPAPGAASAGPAPLLRLTRAQYENTIRDLFGADAVPAGRLPGDGSGPSGFSSGGLVAAAEARFFAEAASHVGAWASKNAERLAPCAGGEEAACVRAFIGRLGRRAFRRPLAEEDVTRLAEVYAHGRGALGLSHADAIGLVVEAMVQSPSFLYRWESGGRAPKLEGRLVRLHDDEVAARLSYFLWNSLPDEELFAAADAGALASREEVARHAQRLLASDKARDAIATFHLEWLDVAHLGEQLKNPERYEGYDAALAADMMNETVAFSDEILRRGDGKLATLFLSSTFFPNERLARLYGQPGTTGPELRATQVDPSQRFGILTQASFLARHSTANDSHPIERGLMVYQRLMCGELPPPPDMVPEPKAPGPNLSVRQVFEEHAANPCATACHAFIDPPGFAFENYDAVGAYRAMDGGKPVDSSGALKLADGSLRPFANGKEMVQILAESEDLRRCVTRQWLRYALARNEAPEDEPSFEAAYEAFAASGYDLRALLAAIVTTSSFLYRQPTPEELSR